MLALGTHILIQEIILRNKDFCIKMVLQKLDSLIFTNNP